MAGDPENDSRPGFLKRLWLAAWNLAQIGIALYGLAVIAFLAARWSRGEAWALVAWGNSLMPWPLWIGAALGVIALFSAYRHVLLLLQLPSLIAFLVLYSPMLLAPTPPAQPKNSTVLKVVTYNLFVGSNADQVVDVLDSLDADVIGLQEVTSAHATLIEERLADEYPYRLVHPGISVEGVGLLSRYPVITEELFQPELDALWHLRAVLDINGTAVTIYVTHPAVPSMFRFWNYNSEARDRQIRMVLDRINTEIGPVVMLCDCNTTDQSDIYDTMDDSLDDAFYEMGWGMGFTFVIRPFKLPMARLDYVWYDQNFEALEATVWDDRGMSDHYPLSVRLALKPAQ